VLRFVATHSHPGQRQTKRRREKSLAQVFRTVSNGDAANVPCQRWVRIPVQTHRYQFCVIVCSSGYPRLRKLFADGGCAGPKLAGALAGEPVEIEIVKRTDKDGGFKVIERTFSWLRRNRRLMAHYDALAMDAVRFAKLAMISLMLKRLTSA
jgi:hypothetical protein